MSAVNVKDLNRMIDSKKLERNAVFNRVYDMCQQRVISYAKKDALRTTFEMPEFILGTPPFNLNDALTHVIDRLKNNGFLVLYFFPKLLYISWDVDEISGKKIVQPVALLPGKQGQVPLRIAGSAGAPGAAPRVGTGGAPRAVGVIEAAKPHLANPLPIPRQSLILPHMPSMDLPMPISSSVRRHPPQSPQQTQQDNQTRFFKSISDYKPSGKFVLDLN